MKDAKDLNTVKLWRRLPMMTSSNSSSPSKKSEGSSQDEISMIKLKKVSIMFHFIAMKSFNKKIVKLV